MTLRYKILFSVELLHDYYSTGKCNDFDLYPSAETSTLLKNGQMLCKVIGNKLVVLTKVDKLGKPVVNLPSSGKYVFYMGLNRYQFMSVTNLDTSSLSRFYFTNLNQNISGSTLHITAPISDYDGAVTYQPGQMADDGAGNIFECIKSSTANATSNDSFWASRDKVQYVSGNDLLSFKSRVTNFELSVAAKEFEIQVFGLNTTTNFYDKLVLEDVQVVDTVKTTNQVQVNMSALPPGKYKVDINGEQFDIYMDDNAVYSNTLGIIEIFTHLPNTNSFALLNTDGKVKEFTYTIRFANRRAYWKYMTPRNQVDNLRVTDSMPEIYPFDSYSTDMVGAPTRKDYFLSKQPLLLSEVASFNNFELELVGLFNSTFPAAAKPDPGAAGMLTQTDNDFYCTIFLNY